jgi:hypothetical protein
MKLPPRVTICAIKKNKKTKISDFTVRPSAHLLSKALQE